MAHAQDDLQLSSFEPPVYPLPTDIQIQSAAAVGSTTLAVWGSTMLDGIDSSVGALVEQPITDGVAVGRASLLHSQEARPYGVVSVLSLDDKFIVLWNDRRTTAPGIYLRRIALDGTFLGDEGILVPGRYLLSDSRVYLERTSNGYRLLWGEPVVMTPEVGENAYYYEQNLDPSGELQGGIQRLRVANFDDTLQYSDLPGARIVRRADGSGQFFHSDGRLDARKVPVGRLNRPFHLNKDTTVAVMEGPTGSSRRIAIYRSLFDTLVDRNIPLPAATNPSLAYLGFINRDSSGTYGVIYSQVGTMSTYWIGVFLHRAIITVGDSLLGGDHLYDSIMGGYNRIGAGGNYFTSVLSSGTYISGDDNMGVLLIGITDSQNDRSSGFSTTSYTFQRMFLGNSQRALSIQPVVADIRSRRQVLRIWNDTTRSVVRVVNGSDSINLAAAITPVVVAVPRDRPILIDRGGHLMVAWEKKIRVPTFELVRLDRFDSSGLTPMQSLIPDVRGSFLTNSNGFITWSDLTAALGEGNGAITASATSRGGQETPQGKGPSSWHKKYIVSDTGWTSVFYRSSPTWTYISGIERTLFNPNTKNLTFATKFPEYAYSTILMSCDSSAIVGWQLQQYEKPATNDPIWMFGLDSNHYNLVNYDSIYQVVDGLSVMTHVFSPGEPRSVRYYMLLGDGLLRVMPADSLLPNGTLRDSTINLEILGLEGVRRGNYRMRLPSADYRIAFAERPSDGSIFFLFGADDGLHMTVLDRDLQPKVVDLLLAQRTVSIHNPSIALRGDTLYAVWQDMRDGTDAIFAHRWVLKGVLPDQAPDIKVPPGAPGIAIGTIRPNPARDFAQMRVELSEASSIAIDMVDVLGRVVQHEDRASYAVGTWDIGINVGDLHPGVYFIRLRTSHGETTTRIVVLH
jgi:hypothetical protein